MDRTHEAGAIDRLYTSRNVHPRDTIGWRTTDVRITDDAGRVVFQRDGVEVPADWSDQRAQIAVSHYFWGREGDAGREQSWDDVVDRVAGQIATWAVEDGLVTDGEARTFRDELAYALLHSKCAFNSPVWYNVGTPEHQGDRKPQASACFILGVKDDMASILDSAHDEGMIYKWGSGVGVNYSDLRESGAPLAHGGKSSGPVSFMRISDAVGGSIKSGGKTRRAAKMASLDVDHPDIFEFIDTKVKGERIAKALIDAGFSGDFRDPDGAYAWAPYQNANHSISTTPGFMEAVQNNEGWTLRSRVGSPETERTVSANDILRAAAQAAYESGDPGIHYQDRMQEWNPVADIAPVRATNPCFPAGTRVLTDQGLIPIEQVVARVQAGDSLQVYTSLATAAEAVPAGGVGVRERPETRMVASQPVQVMETGDNPIVRLTFANGVELRCTPNHRIYTQNRGMVEAKDLTADDDVLFAVEDSEFGGSDVIPVSSRFQDYNHSAGTKPIREISLPDRWTPALARFLGHLIGDGCMYEDGVTLTYSNADVFRDAGSEHDDFMRSLGLNTRHNIQPNGTVHLSTSSKAFARWLRALGVSPEKAQDKSVPQTLMTAPKPIVSAFLQGLFGADGCVSESPGNQTRYVGLASTSKRLLQGVQQLLFGLGVYGAIYDVHKANPGSFDYVTVGGEARTYTGHHPNYDLRLSGLYMQAFADRVGFGVSEKNVRLQDVLSHSTRGPYVKSPVSKLVSRVDDGFERTYNLTEPLHHSYNAGGVVVANCSEFVFVDDTACNLATINLAAIRDTDGWVDVEQLRHLTSILITAQEAIVGHAGYPTEKVTRNSLDYRPLGLGYGNLGAVLMAQGVPYDSEQARDYAAFLTSSMTARAYLMSAVLAERVGAFWHFVRVRDSFARVMRQHQESAHDVEWANIAKDWNLDSQHTVEWDAVVQAVEHGSGVRNAQVTVIAPTGTIGFLMGFSTFGMEPLFALQATKKFVNGSTGRMEVPCIEEAIQAVASPYEDPGEADRLRDHIAEHGTPEGFVWNPSPGMTIPISDDELAVFDCAMPSGSGTRSISPDGHLRMMSAIQPFLSGAMSKTVNLPSTATVEDVMSAYERGWELGLKALSIYVDGSKRTAPMSTGGTAAEPAEPEAPVEAPVAPDTDETGRKRLPRDVASMRHKYEIAGHEGYVHMGEYPDGTLGEVFVRQSAAGSTINGLMDTLGIVLSIALQHGVPLDAFLHKLRHQSFEPQGFTGNPDIPYAASPVDYLAQLLEKHYGGSTMVAALRNVADAAYAPAVEAGVNGSGSNGHAPVSSGPPCGDCGALMLRVGTCFSCGRCGATTGCA